MGEALIKIKRNIEWELMPSKNILFCRKFFFLKWAKIGILWPCKLMITILLAFGLIEICTSSTKWDGIPFWWMNPIFSFSIKRSTTHLNLANDQLHKTLVRLWKHVNIASYTWANELRLRIAMTTTSTWTTASQLLTCLQPPKFYLPWSSLPKLLNCEVGLAPPAPSS